MHQRSSPRPRRRPVPSSRDSVSSPRDGSSCGRIRLETELERLGVVAKHSTPNHPQTCGKVERFHQTLKRYLAKQPPAASLADLQLQLDAFRGYDNTERPHGAPHGRTPAVAFGARLKARPAVDRAHVGQPVKLLIADDYVRVVAEDGSLLQELVLDAGRDYQPRLHSSTMS